MNPPDPSDEKQTARRDAGRMVLGAATAVFLIPLLFWLQFGVVSGLAWAVAGFVAAICLLAAVGIYFRPLTQHHTPVAPRGDWRDRLGSFWLVSCAFGVFISWLLPEVSPLSPTSWMWIYWIWVFCAIALPLITAVPLLRYLRGPAIWVGLPLLLLITLLPVWMAAGAAADLWAGPVEQLIPGTEQWEWYLPYTGRSLGLIE